MLKWRAAYTLTSRCVPAGDKLSSPCVGSLGLRDDSAPNSAAQVVQVAQVASIIRVIRRLPSSSTSTSARVFAARIHPPTRGAGEGVGDGEPRTGPEGAVVDDMLLHEGAMACRWRNTISGRVLAEGVMAGRERNATRVPTGRVASCAGFGNAFANRRIATKQ